MPCRTGNFRPAYRAGPRAGPINSMDRGSGWAHFIVEHPLVFHIEMAAALLRIFRPCRPGRASLPPEAGLLFFWLELAERLAWPDRRPGLSRPAGQTRAGLVNGPDRPVCHLYPQPLLPSRGAVAF